MHKLAAMVAVAGALLSGAAVAQPAKPTIVLVHGAFADSSSWNGVTAILHKDGYNVVAAANPLRGVAKDGAYVSGIVGGISGQVVLVGHSYGGEVISAAADGHDNVKSLVFVSALSPDVGESGADLSNKFPGSTLGDTLAAPVKLADGGVDLYIDQSKFRAQFAHDVPAAETALMAVNQRPVTEGALSEKATTAAWKSLPSYFIYGTGDKNIPEKALAFMAERAGSKKTVVVKGASHVVMVSHPKAVAELIEQAAQ